MQNLHDKRVFNSAYILNTCELLRKTDFQVKVSDTNFDRTTNDRHRPLFSSTVFATTSLFRKFR